MMPYVVVHSLFKLIVFCFFLLFFGFLSEKFGP